MKTLSVTPAAIDAAAIDVRVAPAPADFDDWRGLLALLRAAFAYMDGRIDPPSSLHRLDAAALADKARAETLLLAYAGATLVGCLFARPQPQTGTLYLGKLAVAAGYRRRGVAARLLAAAAALARAQRLGELELQVRVELYENRAAFARIGFRETATSAHEGYGRPTSVTLRKTLTIT